MNTPSIVSVKLHIQMYDNKVFDVIGNRENKDAMRILFIENQIGIINALDCLNGGIGMSEQ